MYNGIEINDTRLLVWAIVSSLTLLLTIAVGIFTYFVFNNKENVKKAKRLKALKEKAKIDPIAKKRLEKMERKRKRETKNDGFSKIQAFSLILILFLITLFVGVIPEWTDYIKKDYVVYEGNLFVERSFTYKFSRTSSITLDDGTELTGALGLDEGQHNGKIIYSKRSKIALEIEK